MKYDFGATIRKIRQEKNIKQDELACYLQIKQSTLSKMENGKHYISLEVILNIVNYTKSSILEFFPEDLQNINQLNFNYQLQELHNELRVHKKINEQLVNIINELEKKKIQISPKTNNGSK